MLLTQSIKPSSYLKTYTDESIQSVNETGNPLIITQNGEAKAVLMDVKQYDTWQESLALLKLLAMSEKDVQEGRVQDAASVFLELRAELGSKCR